MSAIGTRPSLPNRSSPTSSSSPAMTDSASVTQHSGTSSDDNWAEATRGLKDWVYHLSDRLAASRRCEDHVDRYVKSKDSSSLFEIEKMIKEPAVDPWIEEQAESTVDPSYKRYTLLKKTSRMADLHHITAGLVAYMPVCLVMQFADVLVDEIIVAFAASRERKLDLSNTDVLILTIVNKLKEASKKARIDWNDDAYVWVHGLTEFAAMRGGERCVRAILHLPYFVPDARTLYHPVAPNVLPLLKRFVKETRRMSQLAKCTFFIRQQAPDKYYKDRTSRFPPINQN